MRSVFDERGQRMPPSKAQFPPTYYHDAPAPAPAAAAPQTWVVYA